MLCLSDVSLLVIVSRASSDRGWRRGQCPIARTRNVRATIYAPGQPALPLLLCPRLNAVAKSARPRRIPAECGLSLRRMKGARTRNPGPHCLTRLKGHSSSVGRLFFVNFRLYSTASVGLLCVLVRISAACVQVPRTANLLTRLPE